MAKKGKKKAKPKRRKTKQQTVARCGLCGKAGNLTKTECCGQWICDDEDKYVMFSYERNSCSRNHRRFTLCGGHFEEGHEGSWKDCEECRAALEPEMYVYLGANEYNFEVLENPPPYEPTKCSECGATIVLSAGGYGHSKDGYKCYDCITAESPGIFDKF